jgi:hypothetical protein
LVKGISSYGLTKLRKRAGVEITSEVTQSNFNKSKMQPSFNETEQTNPAMDERAFSKFPKIKPHKKHFMQTMGNLDSNKINSTTENFIRN